MRGGRSAVLASGSVLVALALAGQAAAGDIERVSVGPGGVQANGVSVVSSVSADGRYVAFASTADNLTPGDANGVEDVFLRDRRRGTTTLVSVSSAGVQGDGPSYEPLVSDDGNTVLFLSDATTLVDTPPQPGWSYLYLRDVSAGRTTSVPRFTVEGSILACRWNRRVRDCYAALA